MADLSFLFLLAVVLVVGTIASRISDSLGWPRILGWLIAGILVGILSTILTGALEYYQEQNSTNETLLSLSNPLTIDVLIEELQTIALIALSIVLFREGLEINVNKARRVIVPIFLLAFPVVLLSTFVVGATIGYVLVGGQVLLGLVIAGVTTPTDPAATFSLFKGGTKIRERIYITLGGESALNDAIALVLVEIWLLTSLGNGELSFELSLVWDLTREFVGGILLGLALAYIAIKGRRFLTDHLDISFLTLGAALLAISIPSIVPAAFHVSPPIAALSAGVVFGNPQLIGEDHLVVTKVTHFWEDLGFLAELFSFVTLGAILDVGRLNLVNAFLGAIVLIIFMVVSRLVIIPLVSYYFFEKKEAIFLGLTGNRGLASALLALIVVAYIDHTDTTDIFTGGIFEDSQSILQVITLFILISVALHTIFTKKIAERLGVLVAVNPFENLHARRLSLISQVAAINRLLEEREIDISTHTILLVKLQSEIQQVNSGLEEEKKKTAREIKVLNAQLTMLNEAIVSLDLAYQNGSISLEALDSQIEDLNHRIEQIQTKLRYSVESDEDFVELERNFPLVNPSLDQRVREEIEGEDDNESTKE